MSRIVPEKSGLSPVENVGSPIDWERLDHQAGGDGTLAREVLALFVIECDRALETLTEGEAALVHRLKGTARSVGANAVARACEACEAQGCDAASLADLAEALRDAAAAARERLASP
ncbi:MAG: hypothetical protein DI629_06980 [Mesorhizobium amorphae]|nr:MAG: hypothetical protein DI629_06980 [Mesorhizobium amorphae]